MTEGAGRNVPVCPTVLGGFVSSLATVEDLERRMMVSFDTAEREAAEAALTDISALARLYGLPGWGDTVPVPDVVKAVVLAVAERRMRNPEGYVSEMAGEYQYRLPEAGAAANFFRPDEISVIRQASGRTGITSVPVTRAVKVSHRRYYPFGKDELLGDI